MLCSTRRVSRILHATIRAQRPDNLVIRKAVIKDGAAVVEDECVGFANVRGRAQHAADI